MSAFTPQVFTVSQLNRRIGGLIASDATLQTIFIEGELSNLRLNAGSGHLYFSLKDSGSVIRAVMFAYAVKTLRFRPVDGMKVIMRAQVTVYEPMGQYQLKVEDMQPDGVGVLAMQLEQLKKKLSAEGLFDPAKKKPLPAFPQRVGIITSPTGAALRDMLDILSRRFPCIEVILAPVLVQGEGAPAQLIEAIHTFSNTKAADVVIIGRGGGSMEDLWAFNDEGLARAIYACEVPVVSAVGHETDVTLCDFVSDLRAPTPSAAAELVVPNRDDLLESVFSVFREGKAAMSTRFDAIDAEHQRTKDLILARSPISKIEAAAELSESLSVRVEQAAAHRLSETSASARELFAKVELLNPVAVLNRGFAYIMSGDENVRSVEDVAVGDFLDITVSDGHITAVVTE
jgi:exodeoxyribonuclease VII large subunit